MAVIDFHAHILPGADHGSTGLDVTRQQLSLLADVGVTAVVATPHFYPNYEKVDAFLARREASAAALRAALDDTHPTVYLGAEVLVCNHIHKMEGLERLCVKGTNTVLLEMPFTLWGDELYETVLAVRDMGLSPVLAHIERYPYENVKLLLDSGIPAQINAGALEGMLLRGKYQRELQKGRIVAIGSDLHGADPKSAKRLARFLHRLGDNAPAVLTATQKLLDGAEGLL